MKLIYSLLFLTFIVNVKGQNWDWAFSTYNLKNSKTVITPDSSVYVAGDFFGDSCIMKNTLIQGQSGKDNVILLKLTWAGNLVWTKVFSAPSIKLVNMLQHNNDITIGANFTGNLTGNLTDSSTKQKIVLAKYSSAGNLLSYKKEGGQGYVNLTGLDLLSDGSVIACGQYTGTANFSGSLISENSGMSCFFVKYNQLSSVHFIKNIIGNNSARNIRGDGVGNIYIDAYFIDTVKIENDTVLYFSNTYQYIRQLVKFNVVGKYQKGQVASGWCTGVTGFSVDGTGDYTLRLFYNYGCNQQYEGIFIDKVNKWDTVKWSHSHSGSLSWANPSRTMHSACMSASQNQLYFAAQYAGTFTLGTNVIQNFGMVIAQMDHSGNYQMVLPVQYSLTPASISKPLHNSVIISGSTFGNSFLGAYPILYQGPKSGFIGKLSGNNLSVALNEIKHKMPEFTIYPNPSKGKFMIENSLQTSVNWVKVYNSNGQLVYKQKGENSIDLSEQLNGLYIFEIGTDSNIYKYKVIVE